MLIFSIHILDRYLPIWPMWFWPSSSFWEHERMSPVQLRWWAGGNPLTQSNSEASRFDTGRSGSNRSHSSQHRHSSSVGIGSQHHHFPVIRRLVAAAATAVWLPPSSINSKSSSLESLFKRQLHIISRPMSLWLLDRPVLANPPQPWWHVCLCPCTPNLMGIGGRISKVKIVRSWKTSAAVFFCQTLLKFMDCYANQQL